MRLKPGTLLSYFTTAFISPVLLFADTVAMAPRVTVEKPVPSQLKSLHMENPYARLFISVDRDGEVIDALCVWATHHGLVEEAYNVLQELEFVYGDEDFYNNPYTFELFIDFRDFEQEMWKQTGGRMVPTGDNVMEHTRAKLYRSNPEEFVYKLSSLKDIDRPMQLLEGNMVVVRDKDGNAATGQVIIDFYVDHDGRTRFPSIVQSSDPLASQSAILTVRKLRYASVSHDGKPTYVKLRQPFNYE